MKVEIYKDEAYPVYGISKHPSPDRYVEITEEQQKKWRDIEYAYEGMQIELSELYKSQFK